MKVRLVLLPEAKLDLVLKGTSLEISKKYNTLFKLDSNHIPHITVTTIVFEDKYLSEIIKKAEELINDRSNFLVTTDGVKNDGLGSISIHFKNTKNIKYLYNKAVAMYGNNYLIKKQILAPHLTLTKLISEHEAENCVKEINEFRDDFLMEYLAICEDGEFGTCTKIIKRYKIINEAPSLKATAPKEGGDEI